MEESNPRILICSDLHLGALNSNVEQFSIFLNRIINGDFGDDLQALVLLGDFLDLGTTVERTFYTDKKITAIFAQLIEIKKKIHIIFVPGNHEIPVTSGITLGVSDEKFKRRKEKFMNRFTDSIVGELYESNMVCQYLILSKWENENALLLYDSQNQIYNQPIQTIKIDNLELEENYKGLMVHGYQFESDTIRIFVAPFWKQMIDYQNIEIKEVYNYFWNYVIKEQKKIKPITIEDMKSDLTRLRQLSSEEIDAFFSDLSSLEFKLIKVNMKLMKKYKNTRDPSYYIDGIEEFFEEVECDFSLITHLIYGHSHMKGMSNETLNNQNIEIINSGTWQHSNPSYAEILYKGKINLKSLSL